MNENNEIKEERVGAMLIVSALRGAVGLSGKGDNSLAGTQTDKINIENFCYNYKGYMVLPSAQFSKDKIEEKKDKPRARAGSLRRIAGDGDNDSPGLQMTGFTKGIKVDKNLLETQCGDSGKRKIQQADEHANQSDLPATKAAGRSRQERPLRRRSVDRQLMKNELLFTNQTAASNNFPGDPPKIPRENSGDPPKIPTENAGDPETKPEKILEPVFEIKERITTLDKETDDEIKKKLEQSAISTLRDFFAMESYEHCVLFLTGHSELQPANQKVQNQKARFLLEEKLHNSAVLTLQNILDVWAERKRENWNRKDLHSQGPGKRRSQLLIIVDSCYSGGWVDELRAATNMVGEIDTNGLKDVSIQASSRVSQTSIDQSGGNGGVFLNNFLHINGLTDLAYSYQYLEFEDNVRERQNPQFFSSNPHVSEVFNLRVGFNSWSEVERWRPFKPKGTFVSQKGDFFSGTFKSAQLHGPGEKKTWQGLYMKGIFANDRLNGLGHVEWGGFRCKGYFRKGILTKIVSAKLTSGIQIAFADKDAPQESSNGRRGHSLAIDDDFITEKTVMNETDQCPKTFELVLTRYPNGSVRQEIHKDGVRNGNSFFSDLEGNLLHRVFDEGVVVSSYSVDSTGWVEYSFTPRHFDSRRPHDFNDSRLVKQEIDSYSKHLKSPSTFRGQLPTLFPRNCSRRGVVDPTTDSNMAKFIDVSEKTKNERNLVRQFGYLHGLNKFLDIYGNKFEGNFVQGFVEGTGTYTDKHGMWEYRGSWKKSMRWGHGIMKFPDGSKYTGEWKADLIWGEGTFVTPSREVYTGFMFVPRFGPFLLRGKVIDLLPSIETIKSPLEELSDMVLRTNQRLIYGICSIQTKKKSSLDSQKSDARKNQPDSNQETSKGKVQGLEKDTFYFGEVQANLRHGFGRQTTLDQSLYEGIFYKNRLLHDGVRVQISLKKTEGEMGMSKKLNLEGGGLMRPKIPISNTDKNIFAGHWQKELMHGEVSAQVCVNHLLLTKFKTIFNMGTMDGPGSEEIVNYKAEKDSFINPINAKWDGNTRREGYLYDRKFYGEVYLNEGQLQISCGKHLAGKVLLSAGENDPLEFRDQQTGFTFSYVGTYLAKVNYKNHKFDYFDSLADRRKNFRKFHGKGTLTFGNIKCEGLFSEGKLHGAAKFFFGASKEESRTFVNNCIAKSTNKIVFNNHSVYLGNCLHSLQYEFPLLGNNKELKVDNDGVFILPPDSSSSGLIRIFQEDFERAKNFKSHETKDKQVDQEKQVKPPAPMSTFAELEKMCYGFHKAVDAGIWYLPGKFFYAGEFKDGFCHGEGKYFNANGLAYESYFLNGLPAIGGKITFPNGDTYEGSLNGPHMHGQGVYTIKGGVKFEGEFFFNRLIVRKMVVEIKNNEKKRVVYRGSCALERVFPELNPPKTAEADAKETPKTAEVKAKKSSEHGPSILEDPKKKYDVGYFKSHWKFSFAHGYGVKTTFLKTPESSNNDPRSSKKSDSPTTGYWYEGFFALGRRHGEGKSGPLEMNLKYEGQFQNNLFHGYGTLTLDQSHALTGNFCRGKFKKGDFRVEIDKSKLNGTFPELRLVEVSLSTNQTKNSVSAPDDFSREFIYKQIELVSAKTLKIILKGGDSHEIAKDDGETDHLLIKAVKRNMCVLPGGWENASDGSGRTKEFKMIETLDSCLLSMNDLVSSQRKDTSINADFVKTRGSKVIQEYKKKPTNYYSNNLSADPNTPNETNGATKGPSAAVSVPTNPPKVEPTVQAEPKPVTPPAVEQVKKPQESAAKEDPKKKLEEKSPQDPDTKGAGDSSAPQKILTNKIHEINDLHLTIYKLLEKRILQDLDKWAEVKPEVDPISSVDMPATPIFKDFNFPKSLHKALVKACQANELRFFSDCGTSTFPLPDFKVWESLVTANNLGRSPSVGLSHKNSLFDTNELARTQSMSAGDQTPRSSNLPNSPNSLKAISELNKNLRSRSRSTLGRWLQQLTKKIPSPTFEWNPAETDSEVVNPDGDAASNKEVPLAKGVSGEAVPGSEDKTPKHNKETVLPPVLECGFLTIFDSADKKIKWASKLKCTFSMEAFYEGEISEGKLAGFGTITFSKTLNYTGAFQNNRPHGPGILTLSKDQKIEGYFRETYPNSCRFDVFCKNLKTAGYWKLEKKPANSQVPDTSKTTDKNEPSVKPQTPDTTQAPVNSQAPETSKVPDTSQTPDKNQTPDKDQSPEKDQPSVKGQAPDTTQAPANSQAPDTSKTPDKGQAPANSQVPDTSKVPDATQALDKDQSPDKNQPSVKSQAPDISRTPDNVQPPSNSQVPDHKLYLPDIGKIVEEMQEMVKLIPENQRKELGVFNKKNEKDDKIRFRIL